MDSCYGTAIGIRICTRPGSGGSNAHLLPEVLVNTDTHLDLFDSESEGASDFEELI